MNGPVAREAARDIRACLVDIRVNLVRTVNEGIYTICVWDMATGTTVELETIGEVAQFIAASLSDSVGLD